MQNFFKILRTLDKILGSFFVLSFLVFSKVLYGKLSPFKKSSTKVKSILVIRLWALGESILTLPMISVLKNNNFLKVDVLVSRRNKEVFESVDFVDDVLLISDFKRLLSNLRNYDLVIDTEPYFFFSAVLAKFLGKKVVGFAGLFRDKLYDFKVKYKDDCHAVLNFCNLLSPLNIHFFPEKLISIRYTNEDKVKVNELLNSFNLTNGRLIGIHCGTAETAPWRGWKKQKFAELISKVAKMGYFVILTGGKREYLLNEEVISLINEEKIKNKVFNFAGKTNLRELAYLLTNFEVFISNDTGPMHLSAAMGTKTIGLFGPNLPERFAPFGKGNVAIYKASNLNCSPCINVHKGEFRSCKFNGKCMDLIEVEDVYKAFLQLIKK
ncbi:MAG: glycosyltransferase family 9 protein [Thermodesulfobacteria bacterium]|nr:glycosyltransferase family 9 protein [Thermodesulfobacteriota bacterium]